MSSRRLATVWALAATLTAVLLCSSEAGAHGRDPVGVAIRETADGVVVRVREALRPGLPATRVVLDGCAPTGEPTMEEDARTTRYTCPTALADRPIRVEGLATDTYAALRIELRDGTLHRVVATEAAPDVVLPARAAWLGTLRSYVTLGTRHLMGGYDHVLFVLGILLLLRKPRPVVAALTAFTVGHSATLVASVLGWLSFPPALAEIGIALSLLLVALQIVRADPVATDGRGGWKPGRAMAATFALGLLHGLGFATALAERGLPEGDVPLALFGFNLGIELAQLALVGVFGCAVVLVRRFDLTLRSTHRAWAGHAIGAVAAMAFLDRLLLLVL